MTRSVIEQTVRRALREHAPMAMHEVVVRTARRLTPHLVRITFYGPSLASFADDGPDQRIKLLLPRPGQVAPVLPDGDDWFASWLDQPDDVRPVVRTYTIRNHRPAVCELDIDVVLRDTPGPGSAWTARAQVGDRAAVYGACAEYDPPPDTAWLLLAGDDTALPAIGAILERVDRPVRVFVEVAGPRDHVELRGGREIRISWVHRDDGATLLDAIRPAAFPDGRPYAWLAAETTCVKAIRRHLLHVRGIPRAAITFMAYWRANGPIDP